jgi:hypothetical protein
MIKKAFQIPMKNYLSCCRHDNRIFFDVLIFFLITVLVTAISFPNVAAAQSRNFFTADTAYNAKRVRLVAIGSGSIYVVSMVGLYNLWYKDYPLTGLHSFNDNEEWLQMDKLGHIGSAYYLGKMGIGMLQWAGVGNKKAAWYGGLMGAFFQTSVEVLDGISPAWGFSWGDVTANALGSALLISQQLTWEEQRITFKFSYHPTKYADLRSDLLGENFLQSMFKDYNGQTYWLSANVKSFIPGKSRFPVWLNFSVGYGAEGMTGAFSNPAEFNGKKIAQYERYRQFYIAPDIDLSRIKTKSRFLNSILFTMGFIKFPMPAIEIDSPGKVKLIPIAF